MCELKVSLAVVLCWLVLLSSSETGQAANTLCAAAFVVSSRSVAFPLHGPRRFRAQCSRSAERRDDDTTSPDEQCSLDDDEASGCLVDAGYTKVTSSFATVQEVFVAPVESLRDRGFPSFEDHSNVIKYNKRQPRAPPAIRNSTTVDTASEAKAVPPLSSHVANLHYNDLVSNREVVLVDTVRRPDMKSVSRAFYKAGPRKSLHFDPSTVHAAIVTCGGLCPGLNNVIRELVHSLYYLYGAETVYGIRGGFHGFLGKPDYPPMILTNELVENIHHEGGTILRSARGGFDMEKIMTFLEDYEIHQLFIIGGDGTHRGAYAIGQECQRHNLNVAVAGIPKTIDNDVSCVDKSFGFASSVEAAQVGIRTAKTEAMCNVPNGIGVIKLMGRSAGFLSSYAALGSGDVDLVLVPEVPIVLEGKDGILPFLRQRIQEQKYAVVVVAEGAGEELLGVSDQVDAGGNRARPQIGEFLKSSIEEYFASWDEEATVKYIDPSYTVRSVPANGADSLYCMELAQNAVHGTMAGLTCFTVGLIQNSLVYLPIPLVVATSPRQMDPHGQIWNSILAMTGQPNTATTKEEDGAIPAAGDLGLEDFSQAEPTLR